MSIETLGKYLKASKGAFPKAGVVGVESPWMDVCSLTITSGKMWVGDPMMVDPDYKTVKTEKGEYTVEVKGMDFKGHRRISRARAYLGDPASLTLGKSVGMIPVDSALTAFTDITLAVKAIGDTHGDEYLADFESATGDGGIGLVVFEYAGNSFPMAIIPCGLGDGGYDVYPLCVGKKTVGVEVEFLAPGFKLEQEVPRLGR